MVNNLRKEVQRLEKVLEVFKADLIKEEKLLDIVKEKHRKKYAEAAEHSDPDSSHQS